MNRSSSSICNLGNGIRRETWFAMAAFFLLVVIFMLPSTALADNLVQNGGFESGDLTGWYLTGNSQNMQVGSDDPHSGNYALDASPQGTMGYINQDFAGLGTGPSNFEYTLRGFINLTTTPPNDFVAEWDGVVVFQFQNIQQTGYQEFQIDGLQASGTGKDTLTFGFLGNQESVWHLDDVDLEAVGTPEPSSLMLLGSGVLALAGMVRRQFTGNRTN